MVALSISGKFQLPKASVLLRQTRSLTAFMLVPKAAVDKDYGAIFGKDDVGAPRQIAPMKPKAISHCVENRSHPKFRRGVAIPDPAHNLASLPLRKDISVRQVLGHLNFD